MSRPHRTPNPFFPAALVALMGVLFSLLPTLYRGGESWWLPLALLLSLGLLAICALHRCLPRRQGYPTFHYHHAYWLFLAPMAWGFLQWLPLPHALLDSLSPKAALLWSHLPQATPRLSLAPYATLERLQLLLLCLAIATLALNLGRRPFFARALLALLALGGLLNALVGLGQLLAPDATWVQFLTPEGPDIGPLRGTFLNRNHFCFFLTMGLCATGALMLILQQDPLPSLPPPLDEGPRMRRRLLQSLLALVLLLHYIPCLLSLSRAGIFSASLVLLLLGLAALFAPHTRGDHQPRNAARRNTLAWLLLGVMAFFFTTPFALEHRFQQLQGPQAANSLDRPQLWKVSWQLARDHWLTGVGPGAFEDTIQQYATPDMPQGKIVHAHNDYLEAMAELGLPATFLLLALLLALAAPQARLLLKRRNPTRRGVCLAGAMALAAAAIHEGFDFNLLALPNAVALSAITGLFLAQPSPNAPADDTQESRHSLPLHHSALVRRLPALAFLLALLAAMGVSLDLLRGGIQCHRLYLARQGGRPNDLGLHTLPFPRKQKVAQQALDAQPRNPAVASMAAREYLSAGNRASSLPERRELWNQAESLLQRALSQRPARYTYWLTLGNLQVALGQWDEAELSLRRAVELAPTLTQVQLAATHALLQMGRQEPAQELRRSLLLKFPSMAPRLLPQLLTPDTNPETLLQEIPHDLPRATFLLPLAQTMMRQRRFSQAAEFLGHHREELTSPALDPESRLDLLAQANTLSFLLPSSPLPSPQTLQQALWQTLAETKRQEALLPREQPRQWNELEALRQRLLYSTAGPLPAQRLQLAQWLLDTGANQEAISLLMPLVQGGGVLPPSPEELRQAQEMLRTLHANPETPEGFRLQALQALLDFRQNPRSLQTLQRLEHLLATYDKAEQKARKAPGILMNPLAWLQIHLLTNALAEGYESMGNLLVAREFRLALLKEHPAHATTLLALEKLAPECLSPEQKSLAREAARPPQGVLFSQLQAISFQTSPPLLQHAHESLTLNATLRIQEGTTTNLTFLARCTAENGVSFTIPFNPLNPQQHASLLWEHDALVPLQATIPNFLLRLTTARNPLPQTSTVVWELLAAPDTPLFPQVLTTTTIQRPPPAPL
ncbi:MAG: O-antigen ligase family protein [Oligosphaeraceae bacterium]